MSFSAFPFHTVDTVDTVDTVRVAGVASVGGTGPPLMTAWRERVLTNLLSVATVLSPLLVAFSLLVRARAPSAIDVALQVGAALTLPTLLIARRLPLAARAGTAIFALSSTSVWVFGHMGFVAGAGVALVFAAVVAVVFFGRGWAFALIAAQAIALTGIGVAVARGMVVLSPVDVDPFLFSTWVRMAGTTTLVAFLLATVIDFVIRQVEAGARVNAETLGSLRLAYEHLRRLHHTLDVAKEEERGFLARELHDELGQVLTALKLRLQIEGGDAHRDTIALIDRLITRVRRLSKELRPALLDEAGLLPALRVYLEGEARRADVAIDFTVGGTPPPGRFPPDLEIASFRAIQEAIGNTLRHAAARRIEVHLAVAPTRVSISVRDDGRGFGREIGTSSEGWRGLMAARERIRSRGGQFEVTSAPGSGTAVNIELPVGDGVATEPGRLAAAPADDPAESERTPWRDRVRDRAISVAAIVAPALASIALLMAPSPRYPIDRVVLAGAGALLPILWLWRRWNVGARARAAIVILFVTAIYVLARAGFGTGVSVLLASSCAVALVCFGRRFAGVLIALSAAAYVVVGVLVVRSALVLDPAEVDPLQVQNWVRVTAIVTLLSGLLVSLVGYVIRYVEEHDKAAREALAELGKAYERLGSLHGTVEAAKEEERRQLAHVLQDELAHSLTALKLRLRLADPSNIDPAAHGGRALVAPESLVDEISERLRRMSMRLRPPLLDEMGLVPALRSYLGGQAALSGVAIEVETDVAADGARLPPEVEIACFRVVQESVTNAIRHARARQVHVRVAHDRGRVTVRVRDDGRGFDTKALAGAAAAGHLGVVGMRGRVHTLGGAFHVRSEPGSGTIVEVVVPF
jgi:signal transduction histidine kinase